MHEYYGEYGDYRDNPTKLYDCRGCNGTGIWKNRICGFCNKGKVVWDNSKRNPKTGKMGVMVPASDAQIDEATGATGAAPISRGQKTREEIEQEEQAKQEKETSHLLASIKQLNAATRSLDAVSKVPAGVATQAVLTTDVHKRLYVAYKMLKLAVESNEYVSLDVAKNLYKATSKSLEEVRRHGITALERDAVILDGAVYNLYKRVSGSSASSPSPAPVHRAPRVPVQTLDLNKAWPVEPQPEPQPESQPSSTVDLDLMASLEEAERVMQRAQGLAERLAGARAAPAPIELPPLPAPARPAAPIPAVPPALPPAAAPRMTASGDGRRAVIREVYHLSKGIIPIEGVGGVVTKVGRTVVMNADDGGIYQSNSAKKQADNPRRVRLSISPPVNEVYGVLIEVESDW